MAKFVKYTTIAGDSWPAIAAKAYGQPERWPEITAANPFIALNAVLAEGVVINVPAVDAPETTTTTAGLPPWRR